MTVAVSTVSSMFDLAQDFLGAVVAAMTTTPAGPPAQDYLVVGDPAWADFCEQAVVTIPTLTEGAISPTIPAEATGRRFESGRVNLVGMTAYAMRCQPITSMNGQIAIVPTAAELTASAKVSYEDGWAIWNYVTRELRAGTLFEGVCSIAHFDGGRSYTPQAGLGGWRFDMRVELQGYDPT